MRRQLWVFSIAGAAAVVATGASADTEFEIECSVSCQAAFEGAVEDIAAALNYKALGPAEATGITGVGVGAFISYTPVENDADWRTLTGTNVDAVGMAGIVATKGLPFGLDVGAFYTAIPET
ncbi:MAG: hypothetical protein ACLGI7_07075, partial [Gammaproteobacteria bacterium]